MFVITSGTSLFKFQKPQFLFQRLELQAPGSSCCCGLVGSFSLKTFQCWYIEALVQLSLNPGSTKGRWRYLPEHTAKATCGLPYLACERFGVKVERQLELRQKSVMTDRCLEWGDYLERCGVGNFFLQHPPFLLVDVLRKYCHLTQHFDLDISENVT